MERFSEDCRNGALFQKLEMMIKNSVTINYLAQVM